MYRIFLSSTFKDLRDHREAVYLAIRGLDNFTCVQMEDFGARNWEADAYCEEQIGQCHIYVGILGMVYGSVHAPSNKSYTEREYDAAVRHGIPRLLFVSSECRVPPTFKESRTNQRRQERFRSRAKSERICQIGWDSPGDLALRVVTAIHNLFARGPLDAAYGLIPQGKLRICLGMGIPQSDTSKNHCNQFITALAPLLHPDRHALIFSGTDGGNLATALCRKVEKTNPKVAIYSFVAEEYENLSIPQSLPARLRRSLPRNFGNRMPSIGMTREVRRIRMVEASDCCILMAGMRATYFFYVVCKMLNKPVIPLLWSGGSAKKVFTGGEAVWIHDQLRKRYGQASVLLFNKINTDSAQAKRNAKQTIQLLEMFRKHDRVIQNG